MKKFLRGLVLLLSILGSISTIIIMALLFVWAFKYWRDNFPIGYPRNTIAFYTAMFVAITTIIFQWIDGRIKSLISSFRMLKRKGGIPDGKRRISGKTSSS